MCERDLQWKVIRKVLSRTSFSHLVRASPRGKSALPARMRPAGADAAECNVPGFMNGASTCVEQRHERAPHNLPTSYR